MLFKPNSESFRAAERLCVCEKCLVNYGSCRLFHKFSLNVRQLKENILKSASVVENETENGEVHKDFIMPGSLCAIVASENSPDTVWFVKINSAEDVAEKNMIDDYGNTIVPGHKFFQAKYLEKLIEKKHRQVYKEKRKIAYIPKTSIVYPFVNFKKETDKYIIDNNELCEVIAYVEHFGLVSF